MPKRKKVDTEIHPVLGRMGPPLKIETPEQLWSEFEKYVMFRMEAPGFIVHGKLVPKPLSVLSFLSFLGITSPTWYRWRNDQSEHYREDLCSIIARIEAIIRDEQISGAISGAYKENIVARINGLKDQTQHEVAVKKTLKDFYDDAGIGDGTEADA
ncbi:MAG: terminase small subunit [Pseudomonadota bacterium]